MIANDWNKILSEQWEEPYFQKLQYFLEKQYQENTVFPPHDQLYNAFILTPYSKVSVVILGQDPYHGAKQAHGLSFSVADSEAKFPPSLRNIFKELYNDLGIERTNKNLTDWAEQGVLLLNTVLSVNEGVANSHRKQGWEQFTDAVISKLNDKEEQVIFVLWGNDAKKKAELITNPQHKIIMSAHPSPLAVRHGFFGSKPFSQVNKHLKDAGKNSINW